MAAPVNMSTFCCIDELLTNPNEVFLDTSEILVKFANNILNNVDVDKFRQIRISNANIERRILPVAGAMQCLFQMGFEEDGEFLRFPKTKLLDDLTTVRNQLQLHREQRIKSQSVKPSKVTSANDQVLPSLPVSPARNADASARSRHVDLTNKMTLLTSEQTFFHKLQSNLLHVLRYEDESLQKKARQCIPVQKCLTKASEKAVEAKRNSRDGEKPLDSRDFLLLEMLSWFKNSFFKWVDSPECSSCSVATQRRGMVNPTEEEKRFGANRVEGYYCNTCKREERFPRYNDPAKLLLTKRGRCGEWANCFTLCCRAMGFEARYIFDWTDHVWTEVYSDSQSRWLHCDPCENACDKPLMYEVGWKKSLTYIIGFSKDDIKDVTWRYTRNVPEILKRRKECRESWLVDTILRMRTRKQANLSETRRAELLNRSLQECSELLKTKDADDEETQGRSSGSLAWKLSRGEAGTNHKHEPVVIQPSEKELAAGRMVLKYSCALDRYDRPVDKSTVTGWQSLVYELGSVSRKEELDWKMVYLARNVGTDTVSLSWKIELSGSTKSIEVVDIMTNSSVFENGTVSWKICGKNTCIPIFPGRRIQSEDLRGDKELTLQVTMAGGRGDSAWQHAQLFRQKVDPSDQESWPFQLEVTFS